VLDEHGRDAYGATVRTKLGDRAISRDVRATWSYFASNDPRVHVGLGDATTAPDVSVEWVDGAVESYGDLEGDRYVTLRRGGGTQ
jgi:hypothetical protein